MIALKRGFLIGMLVLIGLAAVVCVGALLMDGRGPYEEVPMLSALALGYLLALAFGAFYAMEKGAWWVKTWGGIGLGLTALNVIVLPLYFWWEQHYRYARMSMAMPGGMPPDYRFEVWAGEMVGTLIVFTSWMVLVPVVLTPRMTRGRIVQLATAVSMTAAFFCFLTLLWSDGRSSDLERVLPASLILSGAGMLAVLVINRFLGIKVPDILTSVTQRIWLRCPRCLKEQDVVAGESRCTGCKLMFKLEVEEPRCGKCGYNLHALTRPVCPECGTILRDDEVTVEDREVTLGKEAELEG